MDIQRGLTFRRSKLLQELRQVLILKQSWSTPYNPQCNGQVERMNRILAERISMLTETQDQNDWDQKLPAALSAIETTPDKATDLVEWCLGNMHMTKWLCFCGDAKHIKISAAES